MIDKLLVTAFCLIIATALVMQLMYMSLPFFKRLELDALCHVYVMEMDRLGGLDAARQADLTRELASRGFAVQSVAVTSQGVYGQPMDFSVSVTWPSRQFSSVFATEEIELCYIYSTRLLCRIAVQAFPP